MDTVWAAYRHCVDTAPSRPLLTWHRPVAGARVELSAATLDNWVAKTAALLQDEFDAGPGTTVVAAASRHWLWGVWPLATWAVGATIGLDAQRLDPGGADVLITAEAPDSPTGADLLIVPTDPWALASPDTPPGAVDFATAVRGMPDRFSAVPPDPSAPAVTGAGGPGRDMTHAALAAAAVRLAEEAGLSEGSRVLLSGPPDPAADLLTWASVLLAGGSAVLVDGGTPAEAAAAAAAEGATPVPSVHAEGHGFIT